MPRFPALALVVALASCAAPEHPRAATLRAQGLEPSSWGWLPSRTLEQRRPDRVPDGDTWVAASDSDAAHDSWDRARTLEFTFVRIKSDLLLK